MTCNETNRPLELYFGVEKGNCPSETPFWSAIRPGRHFCSKDVHPSNGPTRLTHVSLEINCTNPVLPDPLYHLLEFYVHNDAPLTCRIPTHPFSPSEALSAGSSSSQSAPNDKYIPLIFAISGALQLSHLHINPVLNVVLHTSPDLAGQEADILAATAYSSPSLNSASTKVVIGDPLALQLSVKWYSTPNLPPSTTVPAGLGGHVHLSTVFYCLLSCGVGVAGSLAYFRGVELPRRIKRYGKDKIGGERGMGGGYAFPGSGSIMNGYGPPGKRD